MDLWQIIKKNKILILIFVIALIIRTIFLFSSPLKIWDETVYANLGYDLSKNPLEYSVENNGWSDFIPGGKSPYSWPNIGFRAPLLPYLLSILYLLKLDFFIEFFILIIGALSVCLVYLFGKKIFNEKTAFYSAILLSILPLHVIYSAKILTDVLFSFFVLLTFFSFWKGYEENNKRHKILFGVFLALTLLSRYTALWIMPIFLFYFIIRDKSLKFLKDKYLWYAIGVFFLTLIPWFLYSYLNYNNILGAFIHGFKASGYWGGLQSWYFFFDYWWQMFSIIGFIFLAGLIYILYKKEFMKRSIYLLLIWFAFFLGMAIYMPHKEDRFILAIVPVIVLISGYFIDKIKEYKKLILIAIVIICLFSLHSQFYNNHKNSYTDTNKCFLEANKFLSNEKNAIIITEESTIVYYYTKQETHFYPNPWNYNYLITIAQSYNKKTPFVLFTNFDMPLDKPKNINIKEDLDKNLERVFECSRGEGYSAVYALDKPL